MRGLLFGRRIRVTLGNLVVTDIDPAQPEESALRSLDVSFSTEAHTKLAPMATTCEIIGLNRDTRAKLTAQQKAASELAWTEYQKVLTGAVSVTEEEQVLQFKQQLSYKGLQLKIEAGYQDDFALIADATLMPDGVEHDETGVPRSTLTAQDGRYPWQNGFVSEEMAPGVTFRDWGVIEQLSEGFLSGETTADEIEAAAPELLVRKDFAGYLNGRVLEGDSSARVSEMIEALGLVAFFDRGQRVFLRADAVLPGEAVVLRLVGKSQGASLPPAPGGLLSYKKQSRGFLSVLCLLNHRLSPGRQVLVQDERGKPIEGGVFRCDYVQHRGSTMDSTFHSEAVLRPVTISLARNV